MVSFRTRSSRGDLQLVGHSVRLLDDRSRIAGAESLADFAKLKSSGLDLFLSVRGRATDIYTVCRAERSIVLLGDTLNPSRVSAFRARARGVNISGSYCIHSGFTYEATEGL